MGHEQQNAAQERERAEERTLVARSQRGDRAAFNQLVERHQSGAYALALRMLGDPDLAADVTQDAFFSAYRAIDSFRGASFRAWLYRIVNNGCIDHFRAQTRRPVVSLEATLDAERDGGASSSDAHLPQSMIDASWDPERVALQAETIEQIQTGLLQLPAEQRLALILSDVQGLPYDEIAHVMNTSLGTVKSRIARGRAHLRTILVQQWELSERKQRPGKSKTSQ